MRTTDKPQASSITQYYAQNSYTYFVVEIQSDAQSYASASQARFHKGHRRLGCINIIFLKWLLCFTAIMYDT